MQKVCAIYIFCGNKTKHQQWTKQWTKIKGVFISVTSLCESLKKFTNQVDHDTITISYLPKQTIEKVVSADDDEGKKSDQLPPSYMYSSIFKDIILEIDENDEKPLKDLIAYCLRNIPKKELGNSEYLNRLDYFQNEYHKRTAVWWYSDKNIFLYSMLNRALRTVDMEAMIKVSFFIRHLHRQLEQLYKERPDEFKKSFTVYRGQGLLPDDFKNLRNTEGGLLSFDSFLSTSTKREIAEKFVQSALPKYKDNVGVIFVMTIDPNDVSTSTTPFAPIKKYSAFQEEEEILFSMHTIFRVGEIQQSIKNNRVWEVQLMLTGNNDPQLTSLIKYMKEKIDGKGWYRMGKLMLKVGHFDQAEILYNDLLRKATNDSDKADIYQQLGELKIHKGQYQEAIAYYEKSIEIKRDTVEEDNTSLALTYNDIGLVYSTIGDYAKALEFNEKSQKIYEKGLPPNHPDLATSYNNIAAVHYKMDDYSKALEFYEKSNQIFEKALPSNHPDLATSYNNIASVYSDMGNYSKALEFYEKDLEITEKTLPPNHPDLAISFNNIGLLYDDIGDYSKALEFHETALAIRKKSLPLEHPAIKRSIDNIASVKKKM
ncbi:unnamed protein product [Rotaria magnacalcarata]|uniref:Multifunctional fusion protein n=1 Tax=Rotaria magnacalcarata TaxID=392030 RepID=A0A819PD40_9BILA|nr:unnamed protein product [Rotaria magnacalcarata]CAF2145851.1 unnamed protein product [Rotaria magnacalcarata]CAF4004624.1 unnamed protein product [Rotaria magnacalcarata]CAF4012366.1 unnamed protein product [Rotaria magnacalcarata]